MVKIAETQSYKKMKLALNELLNELIDAKMHGDAVNDQVLVLKDIMALMRKLVELKPKPWEEIGISRSTYYRDQQRAKKAGIP